MSRFGLMPHRKQCSVIPKTGKSYSIFNEQIPSTFLWIELLTHRKGNDLKYWQNCELEKTPFINVLFIGHLTILSLSSLFPRRSSVPSWFSSFSSCFSPFGVLSLFPQEDNFSPANKRQRNNILTWNLRDGRMLNEMLLVWWFVFDWMLNKCRTPAIIYRRGFLLIFLQIFYRVCGPCFVR